MAAGLDCHPAAPAGHVYMVAGHSVQFPHKAYGTQLSFMNQARPCSLHCHKPALAQHQCADAFVHRNIVRVWKLLITALARTISPT